MTCPSPVFLPLEQRQHDAQGRVHARGDVGHGHAGPGGLVRVAGGGDDAGFALDQQVVCLDVAVRAVLTVARERAVDEPWVQLVEGLPAEPNALSYAGGIVLEEDVGGFRQLVENLEALRLLDVHREASLVSIEPHVARGQALHGGVPVADQVADAGRSILMTSVLKEDALEEGGNLFQHRFCRFAEVDQKDRDSQGVTSGCLPGACCLGPSIRPIGTSPRPPGRARAHGRPGGRPGRGRCAGRSRAPG